MRTPARGRQLNRPSCHLLFFCALSLFAAPVVAQAPSTYKLPDTPTSMGQPDLLRVSWGPTFGYSFKKDKATGRLFLGITPAGIAPHLGINLINMEIAAGVAGDQFDSRVGIYLQLLFTRFGAVYNINDKRMDASLGGQFPLRRGGLLHRGEVLRLDYLPRVQELQMGISFNRPLRRYRPSRPFKTHVSLTEGPDPDPRHSLEATPAWEKLAPHLAHLDGLIRDIDAALTPRFRFGEEFDASAQAYKEVLRGRSFADLEVEYHSTLDAAFVLSCGDSVLGPQLGRLAEAVLFEQVLVPYNRTFAQKRKPLVPRGAMQTAASLFAAAVDSAGVSGHAASAANGVFRRLLAAIDSVVEESEHRWEQSRLVWLPLNYGLRSEQYDSQAEWDGVLAQLVDQPLSDTNTIEYILNDQFYRELKKLLRDTKTYQVTIIHDFRGRHAGETDITGWDVVVDGYIDAFRNAVRDINSGERQQIPEFTLFIDQHFYQQNNSRKILGFLEELYDADVPDIKDAEVRRRVTEAITDLRSQIHTSPVFAPLKGKALRDLFKVHINVTNVADPSFPFDVLLRDHRKLAFRDASEEEPGEGVGIFTGQGIGDHYTGADWEDRSMLLRGPALLYLKRTAARLFQSQGYAAHEIPENLQERPLPDDYDHRCQKLRERGWTTPAFVLANDTGFGDKKCTVLKAAMFNLALPGSVLFSFDSLWISDYWAAMSISAALRGARIYPVAPAPDNAPSSALPTMVLMRENLQMMMRAGETFAAQIAAADGRLRIGLYAHEISVADAGRRAGAFLQGRETYPFLQDEFPIHPIVLAALARAASSSEPTTTPQASHEDSSSSADSTLEAEQEEVKPFLHLKTQFFASRKAIEVLGGAFWTEAIRAYMRVRELQVVGEPSDGVTPALLRQQTHDPNVETLAPDGAGRVGQDASVEDYLEDLSDQQYSKVILSMLIGSFNQDRRSMLLNGEILLAVCGEAALITLPDFMFILGTAAWPANATELNKIFPNQKIPGATRRYFRQLQDLI